jgi:hypothetical protein
MDALDKRPKLRKMDMWHVRTLYSADLLMTVSEETVFYKYRC